MTDVTAEIIPLLFFGDFTPLLVQGGRPILAHIRECIARREFSSPVG